MKNVYKLTKENLNKYYLADGNNGEIIRRKNCKSLGYVGPTGYVRININPNILGRVATAKRSRMIWILINGTITNDDLVIDHINGIKTDDRISNLRLTTVSANGLNKNNKTSSNSKSGYLGVSFHKKDNAWIAHIMIKGKRHYKSFKTKTEAINCRLEMQKGVG